MIKTRTKRLNVPAVFPDHEKAVEAVEDLSAHGLANQHLVEEAHTPTDHITEVDADHDVLRAVWTMGAFGAMVGAMIGITIVALGQLLAGENVSALGTVLAGGYGCAGFGFFVGTVAGLGGKMDTMEQDERWSHLDLKPGETLVVVNDHGHARQVRSILEAHGAKILSGRAA